MENKVFTAFFLFLVLFSSRKLFFFFDKTSRKLFASFIFVLSIYTTTPYMNFKPKPDVFIYKCEVPVT